MNDESIWRAVHRMEAAAESVSRAANQSEEAARRMAAMLEDGYGGNGLRLIELLQIAAAQGRNILTAEAPSPSVPEKWRGYPEFVPEPDTECLVEVQYEQSIYRAVDRWEKQIEFSSATVEVGYGWSEHDDAVKRWIPISQLLAAAPEPHRIGQCADFDTACPQCKAAFKQWLAAKDKAEGIRDAGPSAKPEPKP